jgi:hypothetical protein
MLGEPCAFTDISQIWKRFPMNYNPKTHELTWSYSKLSDIYNRQYKERKREFYIKMQETILHTLFASLELSFIRYNRTKKGFFLDSHVCFLSIETIPQGLQCKNRHVKDTFRFSPIIPLYKEGLLQNRSDICIASNQSVCIKYIHTNELGPPCYRICWNWSALKNVSLKSLIEHSADTGCWNILPGDSPTTLNILEQY